MAQIEPGLAACIKDMIEEFENLLADHDEECLDDSDTSLRCTAHTAIAKAKEALDREMMAGCDDQRPN